ncbi:MAG: response regulator [Parvularculaceae bacterium]|nr:response regulator [Parvularculaceae bacterium]
MRILLAEDNIDNREMLTRRLERKGFTVISAVDGKEATERARDSAPDLILMDVSMPVMSGIEATIAIRNDGVDKDVPIIALTAHAMDGDRMKCLDAGCNDFATKPVDFKLLQQLIEKHSRGEAAKAAAVR